MNQLFSDKTKFEIIKNDPTLTRLKTVQNYLNNPCKRNEITEAEKRQMRRKSAQLGRAHVQKLLKTNLKKRIMKKLLLDSQTKTASSYDNILHKQCDEVSIGSSLAPVLANIILTEFEKVVVMPLMESGFLKKCHCRYVNDTLVLVKEDHIDKILKTFNSFHNNLRFTVHKFENEDVHFLDLKFVNNGDINIYVKDTNKWLIYK